MNSEAVGTSTPEQRIQRHSLRSTRHVSDFQFVARRKSRLGRPIATNASVCLSENSSESAQKCKRFWAGGSYFWLIMACF